MARGRTRLLRVSATATLTLRWLIPRLSSFQLSNPAIEVRMATSNEPVEALEEPFDVVIRRGSEEAAGYRIIWSLPLSRHSVSGYSGSLTTGSSYVANFPHGSETAD
jgi:DNA-binding transcriptional LysR family regulator